MREGVLSERETEIVQKVIETLTKYLNPEKIFLFGSRVKGKSYNNSDFDFAVDGEKPEQNTQRKITEDIEAFAGLYKVDVVYLKSVDEEFKAIILETGKMIYEKRD